MKDEKGQTLVSFALILPILVMLFALVIVYRYNSTPQRYDIYKYQPSL